MNYFKKSFFVLSVFALLAGLYPAVPAQAQLEVSRDIVFPVIGKVSYINDFGFPRDGGTRWHKGIDIFGKKMQPLVAAVDGVVKTVPYPESSWGYGVAIEDKDGYEYWYIHMNNDTPGTDDGLADGRFAYAQDIQPGNRVVRGQLIGYMGDSGNAETTPAHLHFEIEAPGGAGNMNPFYSLQAAQKLSEPVSTYSELEGEILPFEAFAGGASIALANLDKSGETEIVIGAEAGGGPLVRTFKKDKTSLAAFYAYGEDFRGGVEVASGDVDGDGSPEIVTAPGSGGGPHIRIFDAGGNLKKEFFAYDESFHGGVSVAVRDIDGDGKAEVVTGAGPGGGPHVRVFNSEGELRQQFFAYPEDFRGGVDVEVLQGETLGQDYIVTVPLSIGGSHVKYFDSKTLSLVREFFAYDESFHGGVKISVGSLGGSTEEQLFTVPANEGGPHVKVFSSQGALTQEGFEGFEPWWRGGYDIAAFAGDVYLASGPGRRTSVREIDLAQASSRRRMSRDYFGTTSDRPLTE